MKKILLTGSTGFIGKFLKKKIKSKLNKDYELFCPSRDELDLTSTMAVTYYAIEKGPFDVIMHCASSGRETPNIIDNNIFKDNLLMFYNLKRIATPKEGYCKFFNFGTGAEFSVSSSVEKADDIWRWHPLESYGASKNVITRAASYGMYDYVLRLFSTLDKSESEKRLLKKFIASVKEEKVFEIPADRYCDFFSLRDLWKVIKVYLKYQIVTQHESNCVYEQKFKVSDLIKMFCEIHAIPHTSYKVTGSHLHNYTGKFNLDKLGVKCEGLGPSLEEYEI
tara:strand:+ start:1203 stop:2039 length:837 start_codon:yes stop_codon:yes gene_type:complete